MIYKLFETQGKYKNKNLLTAHIVASDKNKNEVRMDHEGRVGLSCKFYIGDEYVELFGTETLRKHNPNKHVVQITIVKDHELMRELIPSIDDFDEEDFEDEDFEDFIFPPLKKSTPKRYKYRLSGFYVNIKENIQTTEESEYFRGIGHSLLCWILGQIDDGNAVLSLEASGEGSQKKLVEFYTKLGFKTCADNSDVPDEWYKSPVASGICMYSDLKTLKNVCESSRLREFEYEIQSPFESISKD